MRDGVRLFTAILTPKRAGGPLPIILSRTPYGTSGWGGTAGIEVGLRELADEGYIFAFQDIRGRYKSEGEFVMNRPPRDRSDAKATDETTDAWDTVEWLIRNLAGTNSRVGIIGISYPGWLASVAALDPHRAVKAVSPQAPMGDTWMGDDFFHQGAFRQSYGLEYAWDLEASRDSSVPVALGRYDTYDWYLSFPTLGALAQAVGASRFPTWRAFVEHPSYDAFWQSKAVPRQIARVAVPTLTVGGWWDQEDLYGPLATYAALERFDTGRVSELVMGPWHHGGWYTSPGDALGRLRFGSRTSETFRREMQARWFAYWLKDKGDDRFPEARLFDAGADAWRTFDAWPPREAATRSLYFREGARLSFEPPADAEGADQYVSDPAHPVPYRLRPVERTYGPGSRWEDWLAEDQRFVHHRPDVLAWETEPLTDDVQLAGAVVARLFASTTGTDADWVVKLIDVFPDDVTGRPEMGGYQLMVVADILRGRYRKSFTTPEPIAPQAIETYTIDLHQQMYRFGRDHRIMVQVQSTWFPLYDRNPQTFVSNIFLARPSDYRVQTHRVHRTRERPSRVEIGVLPS